LAAKKISLAEKLEVQTMLGTGKYLGMPSMVGRNRRATFKYVKDRIWKKNNSMSGKFLSKAGCEVMSNTYYNLFQHIL